MSRLAPTYSRPALLVTSVLSMTFLLGLGHGTAYCDDADPVTAQQLTYFENEIRPLLAKH